MSFRDLIEKNKEDQIKMAEAFIAQTPLPVVYHRDPKVGWSSDKEVDKNLDVVFYRTGLSKLKFAAKFEGELTQAELMLKIKNEHKARARRKAERTLRLQKLHERTYQREQAAEKAAKENQKVTSHSYCDTSLSSILLSKTDPSKNSTTAFDRLDLQSPSSVSSYLLSTPVSLTSMRSDSSPVTAETDASVKSLSLL